MVDHACQSESLLDKIVEKIPNHHDINLVHRALLFHEQSSLTMEAELRQPNVMPELLSYKIVVGSMPMEGRPLAARLTKLLLNVTIRGSLGTVQVIMSPESTVGDLVAAAVKIYKKVCRRPILPTTNPTMFDLHYSQFSLEKQTTYAFLEQHRRRRSWRKIKAGC
ncbi:hypothetical protein SO802_018630 [Lithocarpus litseifolius]|uniref:DUF7054 domain-containing protein n=1 Tax=Lithocarpus litseifolius TaxID=425828 RepID=A0AAW2CLD9_9ROSI